MYCKRCCPSVLRQVNWVHFRPLMKKWSGECQIYSPILLAFLSQLGSFFFSISHSTLQSTYKIALCTGRLLCNVPLSLWIYPGHYFSIFSNCSVFIEFDDDNHHLEPHGCTPMQYWNRPPTPYTNGSDGCWSFGAFRPFSLLQTTGMN